MIFLERPITANHIRSVCDRFHEGLRVEYKVNLDGNVREQLPKVVSSFANSQGGVLIVGVRALNGVPQGPYEGFDPPPREEFPLTIENICLQSIYPPVLPRTEVVSSDVGNRVFLVVEVEESGEAPHAIENSKRVYVRTGNSANPYDLAEVDLIIDLVKRREEPLERRARLLSSANHRSHQVVRALELDKPFALISICPTFPRRPLCTSQEAWEFLSATQFTTASIVPPNTMRRIPDGASSLVRATSQRPQNQYVELNKHGLLFAARQFAIIPWAGQGDTREQLYFADLFQTLLRLTICAERFYVARGHLGSVSMNVSLHHVQGRAMRFIAAPYPFPDDAEDFRCDTDVVSADRILTVGDLRARRVDVLTDILSDLTWAFWQSNTGLPIAKLRQNVQTMTQQMGAGIP